MAEPKAYEPEKLTSGVTWKWKKTISDYPASEWTLTYYLRKDGATATSFSAAADGDSYLVTVAAATTAAYAAGTPMTAVQWEVSPDFPLGQALPIP